MVTFFKLSVFLVSFVDLSQALANNNSENSLMQYILTDYNPKVRPVKNVSMPIRVKFGIMLKQIINLDFQHQILTLHVWIRTYWKDEFVNWNPKDFGGLDRISVDADKLWVPDIKLYNSASHKQRDGLTSELKKSQIVIDHRGETRWSTPAIISSSCKVDAPHFPFDDQHCMLEFGSWVFDASKMDMDIVSPYVDKESYSENEEWSFYENKIERHARKYNCCPAPYPVVEVTVSMKRRPAFFMYNLIIPCGLITVVSLFSFILPPNSGERVSFIMSVLVALSVYMMIVNDEMPHSAETSLSSQFFLFVMVEQVLSVVASCFVIRFHNNETPLPKWFDTLVNKWIARLVWMYEENDCTVVPWEKGNDLFVKRSDPFVMDNNGYKHEDPQKKISEIAQEMPETKSSLTSTEARMELKELVKEVSVLSDKFRVMNTKEKVQDEWSRAAAVLDRFFLFLLLAITIISVPSIFLSMLHGH